MNKKHLFGRSKEVLLDSSSLILLFKAHLLTLLCRSYQPVIASEVFREITHSGKPGTNTFFKLIKANQIVVLPPIHTELHPELKDARSMGEGELKTLHHALMGEGAFIIIDDLQAIRFCVQQGLPFINSLLLPRLLYLSGILENDDFCNHFTMLQTLGHYSDKVIKKATMLEPEELQQFFPR